MTDAREPSYGWCSLRLRFDQREIELLRGAEHLRGSGFARTPRPEVLRTALSLAKAGQKLGTAAPGASVSLDEGELALLLDALHFTVQEVQWAARSDNGLEGARRDAVLESFPELVQKGVWRSFGLARELESVATRLQNALKG